MKCRKNIFAITIPPANKIADATNTFPLLGINELGQRFRETYERCSTKGKMGLANGKWGSKNLRLLIKFTLICLILVFFKISSYAQFTTVNTTTTIPYCPNTNTGKIVVTPTNGIAPYTYQILSPTSSTPVTQAGAYTFNNLEANTYQIRVTDALGNIQTRTVTLASPSNSNFEVFAIRGLVVNTCDSIDLTFHLFKTYRVGLKFEFWVDSTSINNAPTIFYNTGTNFINAVTSFRVPLQQFGNTTRYRITDSCGYAITGSTNTTYLNVLRIASTTTCGAYDARIEFAGLRVPATFNLYAGSTASGTVLQTVTQNTVVPKDWNPNYLIGGNFTNLSNGTYTMTGTDACGRTYTRTFTFTVPTFDVTMSSTNRCDLSGADSTGLIAISSSTLSIPYTVRVLSGPATYNVVGASPSINTNITYPLTRTGIRLGVPNTNPFFLTDMPPGTYTIQVVDSCGNSITKTVSVTNFLRTYNLQNYSVVPGCLNANKVILTVTSTCDANNPTQLVNSSNAVIASLSGGLTNLYTDSVVNLASGNYTLRFNQSQRYGYMDSTTQTGQQGGSILFFNSNYLKSVPVYIPPYNGATISGSLRSVCPNTGLGALVAKPLGVQPYTFELLGPAGNNTVLRPSQTDSVFNNVSITDSFRVRVTDGCDNASVSANISFTGVITNARATSSNISCIATNGVANFIADTMDLTTYNWSGPNGFTASGRTVNRTITSYSDSGTYKVVTTNFLGCIDSTTVRLTLKPNAGVNQTICQNITASLTAVPTTIGTWSTQSGNPSTATITTPINATTTITGLSVAGIYNFIWTAYTGCTDTISITVNALPTVAAITGTNTVTISSTSTLSNTTAGGVWSSLNTSIATISSGGLVTGVISGSASINYKTTSGAGCINTATYTVTVNPKCNP